MLFLLPAHAPLLLRPLIVAQIALPGRERRSPGDLAAAVAWAFHPFSFSLHLDSRWVGLQLGGPCYCWPFTSHAAMPATLLGIRSPPMPRDAASAIRPCHLLRLPVAPRRAPSTITTPPTSPKLLRPLPPRPALWTPCVVPAEKCLRVPPWQARLCPTTAPTGSADRLPATATIQNQTPFTFPQATATAAAPPPGARRKISCATAGVRVTRHRPWIFRPHIILPWCVRMLAGLVTLHRQFILPWWIVLCRPPTRSRSYHPPSRWKTLVPRDTGPCELQIPIHRSSRLSICGT